MRHDGAVPHVPLLPDGVGECRVDLFELFDRAAARAIREQRVQILDGVSVDDEF